MQKVTLHESNMIIALLDKQLITFFKDLLDKSAKNHNTVIKTSNLIEI